LVTQSPYAGVSLVDGDHVWIKGRFGVDLSCLAREGAFCAAAVDSNQDLFVVNDASADQRFSSNSLVADAPNVRYYAAATITNSRGYRLGTLWTMDDKARDLQEMEGNALQGLAAQAMRLIELKYADPLTQLPNRVAYINSVQKRLNEQVTQETYAPEKCAVGAIQISNLRIINSAYGFDVGNGLITSVANTLRDWAGTTKSLARLEDDYFAFAFMGEAAAIAEQLDDLKARLSSPVDVGAAVIRPITAIGVSYSPDDGMSASSLLDQALAINEVAGERPVEGSVAVTTVQRRESAVLALEFQRLLPQILVQGHLIPFYQPQVDTQSRRVVGLEALARISHPGLELIGPAQFIPLAEQLGVIARVDLAILEKVCADLRSWQDRGIAVVPISVNMSQATLTQEGVVEVLQTLLTQYRIAPNLLEIELTESGLIQWPAAAQKRVDQLHDLGIRISLDDFGTGLSNLATLQKFRIERLKADRSYVHGASSNLHVGGLLRLIHSVTELFEIELMCEGVEEHEDVRWAQEMGCHLFQGFYFCKPLASAAAELLLKKLPSFEVSLDRKRDAPFAAFLQSFY
jgi:diguanylate cyclase (GGDEF)-like protein